VSTATVAPARQQTGALVNQVVRRFGDRVVLDHLDLTIAGEELVVLLGPSGCGKTTLLRLMAGLDRPDGGTVEVPVRRAIVFQGDRLLPWQRALRNVTLGLHGPDADQRARAALAEVGLAGRERAWPKELSGGEAQRVALARALVSDPELVLLDEPFAALDAITRQEMQGWLAHVLVSEPRTVIFVTHDVEEAVMIGDRVVVMSPRPGQTVVEIEVRLPRPRRRTDAAVVELRERALAALGVDT